MTDSAGEDLGALCIVLHGHLPYVLHHGDWPHGEHWLYEAAAETYLPLLDCVGEAALYDVAASLTVGLTPVLLEQLAHPRFKSGFAAYLVAQQANAADDRGAFESRGDAQMAQLAHDWEAWYARAGARFEEIGRDLPAQFAARRREGQIQILTSAATHAYLPLLLNDQSIRAQLACGAATSAAHLGFSSRGMWLPECAYRPTWEHWVPSVLFGDARVRPGLEQFIAGAGIDHFFVDTQLVTGAKALGTLQNGQVSEVSDAQVYWDTKRGWGSPLQPVGVASRPQRPSCFAFARHPQASEQVWSSVVGYPGSAEYLDFHRKHGSHGLRYHRVTSVGTSLDQKQPYAPQEVDARLYEQGRHFCGVVRALLAAFKRQTGRPGVCVAPFDAELFGHWWFEGPRFLRNVIFTMREDPSVRLLTAEQALAQYPPDKVVRMPEGSWGAGGNHSVWINDKTRWMWEMEYRAEEQMLGLLRTLPWQTNAEVKAMLQRAGRELLLLQASDWPFVIHSGGAVDYGIRRFAGHCTRFDRLARIAGASARGETIGELERIEIAEADVHDPIFPTIDLRWWS